MKTCWICKEKAKRNSNHFITRQTGKKILLHNDCYLEMLPEERKLLSYNIRKGPPKGLRSNLKLMGFAIGGLVGGLGYSAGYFGGSMLATKHIVKKKGMTMEELDDICIDKYGYHYPILLEKIQDEVMKMIK